MSRIEREEVDPAPKTFLALVKALKTTPEYLTGKAESSEAQIPSNLSHYDRTSQRYRIRVLGKISAGGDQSSAIAAEMEPRLFERDVVLVQKTPINELQNGDMVVVIINQDEGLVKRYYYTDSRVHLQSDNSRYPPRIFSREEIGIECHIVGRVIEIRAYPRGGL